MGIEIERKFLVDGDAWRQAVGTRLRQGYLGRDARRTVRIRLAERRAFITIKGAAQGATRAEFEYEIPMDDAEQLLKLCDGSIIEKVRRAIRHKGLIWEVDEFLGDNAGLVIAEVELTSEDQSFERPSWLGVEVTNDPRYFNANLVSHPYCGWARSPASAPDNAPII